MPFVLGPELPSAVAAAANHGFPAFELFPPNLDAIDVQQLTQLCDQYQIKLSTIGTGGGWVTDKLSLTDPSPEVRTRGKTYIKGVIQKAAQLGASAIIGSMQGRCGDQDRTECLNVLRSELNELAQFAADCGQPLLYEPLNRYETDLVNSVVSTADFFADGCHDNLKILADLFHMNIEEKNVAQALQSLGHRLGHIHFVDSNRKVAGMGHTDFAPIVQAIKEMKFAGYLAIEAFPLPTQDEAAAAAIRSFNEYFG